MEMSLNKPHYRPISILRAPRIKYEPENLSLVKDPSTGFRYLYFTMMFGSSGANIKHLYTISPSSFGAGGNASGDPINWLLRYNGTDGDVSIATIHPDGDIGCEVKKHLDNRMDEL